MKSKAEIKTWLLKNCVDEDGDLLLSQLDFSDFDGDVYTQDMKVKHNLFQGHQKVGKSLLQNCQQFGNSLLQDNQQVGEDLFQYNQKVKRTLISHKLQNGEVWVESGVGVIRNKKLKPITSKELAEMGYEIKENEK